MEKLQKYEPVVVGLSFYSPSSINHKNSKLVNLLRQENVFGICKVRSPKDGDADGIRPSPDISLNQVTFSDAVKDQDETLRRHLLSLKPESPTDPCTATNHLSYILALYYLDSQWSAKWQSTTDGLQIDIPKKNKKLVIDKLKPFVSGYQKEEVAGVQIFLNYRSLSALSDIAETVTADDITKDKIPEKNRDKLRKRIVLISVIEPVATSNNYWITPYSDSQPSDKRKISGVFIQAHMVSQIISAALDDRPLIWTWAIWQEGFWIFGWSLLGGLSPLLARRRLILTVATIATLCGACYIFILFGGYIPLVPALIAYSFMNMSVLVSRPYINPPAK